MKIDLHHCFAKKKHRKKRYGELIHSSINLQSIDHDKHMSGRVRRFNEREFCARHGLLDCRFCERFLIGHSKPCLWDYGTNAEDCRHFLFDKNKYYEFNRTKGRRA